MSRRGIVILGGITVIPTLAPIPVITLARTLAATALCLVVRRF